MKKVKDEEEETIYAKNNVVAVVVDDYDDGDDDDGGDGDKDPGRRYMPKVANKNFEFIKISFEIKKQSLGVEQQQRRYLHSGCWLSRGTKTI